VDVRVRRDEVLAAVGEHGPASFARLIELTDFGRGQLLGRLQELAKSSLVVKNLDDTWQTIASKDAEIAARNGLGAERRPSDPASAPRHGRDRRRPRRADRAAPRDRRSAPTARMSPWHAATCSSTARSPLRRTGRTAHRDWGGGPTDLEGDELRAAAA
jgi:hypothetical protein